MALTEDMKMVPASQLATHPTVEQPREHRFSPYEFNGGTAAAIAGDDFVVVGADTRLSVGYNILSRDTSRITELTGQCVVATGGCRADVITLHKVLTSRMANFELVHGDPMPTTAVAQLLSVTLYYKRFFPYYGFNIVAGLDGDGKGVVYSYDSIGSFEPLKYASQGSGQKLIIPVLDNVIGYKNREQVAPVLTVDEAVELIKDSFITAAERNIHTGDSVEIKIITKDGMRSESFALKKD